MYNILDNRNYKYKMLIHEDLIVIHIFNLKVLAAAYLKKGKKPKLCD